MSKPKFLMSFSKNRFLNDQLKDKNVSDVVDYLQDVFLCKNQKFSTSLVMENIKGKVRRFFIVMSSKDIGQHFILELEKTTMSVNDALLYQYAKTKVVRVYSKTGTDQKTLNLIDKLLV